VAATGVFKITPAAVFAKKRHKSQERAFLIFMNVFRATPARGFEKISWCDFEDACGSQKRFARFYNTRNV